MLTIGIIELDDRCEVDLARIDAGWNIVQLTSKSLRSRPLKAQPMLGELNAIAILGTHPAKFRYAREALSLSKHVMVDFPPGGTPNEVLLLRELAERKGVRFHSPNLLKTEPGMREFRRTVDDPSSKLLSLTVSCNLTARGEVARLTKLMQMLDLVEWMAGAKSVESRAQKSARVAGASAQVILLTHENGVKSLLNLRSTHSSSFPTFWVDGIFDNSIVHLNPHGQSILVGRSDANGIRRVNWAEPALKYALRDFMSLIGNESARSDLTNFERIFQLARKLA